MKADYVICSVPDHVNITCPVCDYEDDYDWKELHDYFGNDLYSGNHGSITCSYCKSEIELGECEYD
ncbi:hypothetical protein [Enterococcus sp. LJL90]